MHDKLNKLLELNSISSEEFEKTIYTALLNGIFETICNEIKRSGTKVEELSKFRKHRDHLAVTKGIVNRYAKCKLTENEYEYIYTLIRAFFNKQTTRIEISGNVKDSLLKQQNHKCPYCNASITLANSHLDHIIPWDFVGDELDNNYQMLCSRCNERKGTSSVYGIVMMLYDSISKNENYSR